MQTYDQNFEVFRNTKKKKKKSDRIKEYLSRQVNVLKRNKDKRQQGQEQANEVVQDAKAIFTNQVHRP